MLGVLCVTLFFGLCASITDYGPQIVVPWTEDSIVNVSRTIYRTVPLPASCTNFINIAAQMTVPWWELANTPTYKNEFLLQATHSILSWWYWMETRNNQTTPGIVINGQHYCINLTIIGFGFNAAAGTSYANRILSGEFGNFDLYFAPWSSGITKAVAPLYNAKQAVLLAGYAAATEIYRCGIPTIDYTAQPYCNGSQPGARTFPYVWSALPQAEAFYTPLFSVLKIIGAKSIAGFASNESFTTALFAGAIQNAKNFRMNILYTGTIPATPNISDIAPQVAKLKQINADVVLAAPRFVAGCILFMQELKRQNYYPKALLLSQCVDDPQARNALGSDLSYAIDYITWHESLAGSAYQDTLERFFPSQGAKSSSQIFYEKYKARWGLYPDRFSAPVGIVMGYIIEAAYAFAKSTAKEDFLAALNFIRETTFWGTFGFDAFGFDVFKKFISVQVKPDLNYSLIAPLEGSSAFIVYPAPTWDDRKYTPKYLANPVERVGVAFGILGLLFSLACAVWLMIFVHSPSVKAAQPPFLGLMLFGACVLYAVLIVWTLYVTDGLCVARNWLLSLGFIILYGTLVGRVHRVKTVISGAKSFDKNTKVIDNAALFKILAVIVGIDIVILVIWTALSPNQSKIVKPDPLRAAHDYPICYMKTVDIIFIVILGAYKLAIVAYGIYLSALLWQNRSSVFIESRKVIFCFYNLALFAAIWIVLQNTLSDELLLYIFRSACIFVSVFATTVTLFVPRMINPNKITSIITADQTGGSHKHSTGASRAMPAESQKAESLKKKLADLQKQYQQLQQNAYSSNKNGHKKLAEEKSSSTEEEDAEEKARKKKLFDRLHGGAQEEELKGKVEESSSETED